MLDVGHENEIYVIMRLCIIMRFIKRVMRRQQKPPMKHGISGVIMSEFFGTCNMDMTHSY